MCNTGVDVVVLANNGKIGRLIGFCVGNGVEVGVVGRVLLDASNGMLWKAVEKFCVGVVDTMVLGVKEGMLLKVCTGMLFGVEVWMSCLYDELVVAVAVGNSGMPPDDLALPFQTNPESSELKIL